MNPALCREHFAELLREELQHLSALQRLLEDERPVIASADLKALQRSTEARQQRIAALTNAETQRQSLCSMHGQSPDAAGIERLLAWCDPEGTLKPVVAECRTRALKCRALNDRNGMLVAARLKRVDERLQLLRGRTDRAATYGPRGGLSRARVGRAFGAA